MSAALWLRSSAWAREPLLRGRGLQELEAAVRNSPRDALAQYYLAKQYYLGRRFAAAKDAYEAAARLDPGSARTQLGLGLSLYELGRAREAQEAFERALRLDHRLAWAQYMRGKLLWLEGNVEAALPHVRRAAELDPRSDQAWYGLGVCYTQLGRHSEAIGALQKAVERRETSAPYHTALGELLVYRGRAVEGRRHYERALQLNPDYGPACALLGGLCLRSAPGPEGLDRAEELLQRATRQETPRREGTRPAQVWLDLGQLYIRKRQYDRAIAALLESLRRDARDERAYYALANAYRRKGDPGAAKETEARFRRISALHVRMQELKARVSHVPVNAKAHLELARVLRDLGLLDEAAARYATAARLEPRSTRIAEEWKQVHQKLAQAGSEGRTQEFVMSSP